MALLEVSGSLMVTLYIDVLESDKENFSKHLDHHLKSDNWAKPLESNCVYFKDNYIVDDATDFEVTKDTFASDLQDLFNVSTTQLVKHCSSKEPMQGVAQLGNLGHVVFNIKFDKKKSAFTVTSSKYTSYGDSPDLFAQFENA